MSVLSPRAALLPLMKKAGEILRSAHALEETGNITVKAGDANFVTVYDVTVQDFLMREIRKCYPDACFVAEEQENDASALGAARCFVIDPIDATTNFIHDYRHSCISLAMLSHGEVMFGAVYNPYLDEMFCAELGRGAELNGHRLQVSSRPMALGIAAFGTAPYQKNVYADATFACTKEVFLACADVRRCGSAALDLAYLAAGRSDLYFEFMVSPWDYAAGMLLVREAGGIVSDMLGNPLDFTCPVTIMGANPQIYPALKEICRPYAEGILQKD